jgi:hypothetical protein
MNSERGFNMCIAIYKPEGVELLSKDIYEQCWNLNSDGGSISYWDKDSKTWHVVKGLMDWDLWWKTFEQMRNATAIGKDRQVFIHFRVGTAGPKFAQALTHPFPVTDDYEAMGETMFAARNIVAHNGTIGPGEATKSDTMMGVNNYINPLWELVYYKNGKVRNKKLEFILRECLDTATSRWFIANGPEVTLYGPWLFDKMYDTHFSCNDYEFPWNGYGAACGYGWDGGMQTGYEQSFTAKFIRQGELDSYLDDEGLWNWDAWEAVNGVSAHKGAVTTKELDDVVKSLDRDDGSNLVMAIVDEDGKIQWNDEYEHDEDMLCCPDCASDMVFPYKSGVSSHACHVCGCMFNLEGDTFGYNKLVTEMDWGECMYCDDEVLIETSGHCTCCGAMLDLKEVGNVRN